jgi:outer membrane autotransporter protein
MIGAKRNRLMCGVALALLAAPFAVADQARAQCTPTTALGTPANNTTVTCTGTTTNQNGSNGYGTGLETGVTINVGPTASAPGPASVTGDAAGISLGDGTINSSGTIEALGTGGNGGIAIGALSVTVTNSGGTIQALATKGIAIQATGTATVDNQAGGNITGDGIAITAQTVTVDNAGTIEAKGDASGGTGWAISGDVVTVRSNSGTIRENGVGSRAINANNGAGQATVNNLAGGKIIADGADGVAVDGVTVDVTNAGTIQAANGIAIASEGAITVSNNGNGTTTGIITAGRFAISGTTITVLANSGLIEATNGDAIFAATDADIHNTGGKIQAAGRGIFAGGTATVENLAGSTIAGGLAGIASATTVDVTANAGTISGSTAIFAISLARVHNVGTGQINGTQFGIDTVAATSVGQLDITNDKNATISASDASGVGIRGTGSVTSAGTISGGTGAGGASVEFRGTGTNTLTLQAGAVLIGDAKGSAAAGATNNLVLQGIGHTGNNFVGFNSVDVQGIWALDGSSDIGVATVKSGGALVVGGNPGSAVLTGDVTVKSGGVLAGHGIIAGNVSVLDGGFLAPAVTSVAPGTVAPVATLTVSGNVGFGANSTFRVVANGDGTADKLVAGTATLNGATVDVRAGGNFNPSTQYTILHTTANNGLTGTFSNVTTSLAFLTPSLIHGVNDVILTLTCNNTTACSSGTGGGGTGGGGGGGTTGGGGGGGGGGTANPGFGFAAVAQTRNQNAVATGLDIGLVTNPVVLAVLNQTVDGARQAFDALSGEVFASVQNAQAGQSQFTRDAMLGRMRQASYAGAAGPQGALSFGGPELAYAGDDAYAADFPAKAPAAREPSRGLTFWALGLGGWGHADSDGNAASLRSRFGGFLSGADARFGDTWRAGLVAGYTRTDLNVDARASSAGIDSVQFGGYAGGRVGAFNVRGGASLTYDSIDTSRGVFFPGFSDQTHAHFHGNVGQVFGEVGYGMALGQVAVEPLAGLAYVHVHDGSFAESGGAAALSASASNQNLGYSSLGMRFASAVPLANGTVLVPRGTVQWQHAFGDVTPVTGLAFQGTGTAFTTAGIPIARDAALVEAGFDWRFSPQAKLGAFYQGELAAHAQTHAFKGGFTWDF